MNLKFVGDVSGRSKVVRVLSGQINSNKDVFKKEINFQKYKANVELHDIKFSTANSYRVPATHGGLIVIDLNSASCSS